MAKTAGDEVFAGTGNGSGALRVRVTRAANDTVVARIVTMVQEVSATKATTGSDLTLDTADVIIVRDELATLPAVIALSRRARRMVVANLVIACTRQ